jgi:DNA helicase-2/ATP-dependent DNA helicase PcrA
VEVKDDTTAAILHGLNDAQRQAVTSDAAPLCILAGAGSGKTRVITRRIAYRCALGTADPQHVVALTFTRKAAGELRERLVQLGLRERVTAGTFHAIAYAQLRAWWSDRDVKPPGLLERKGRLLGRMLGGRRNVQALDVASEIEWAKARMIAPDRYAEEAVRAGRRTPVEPVEMAKLYERYENEKRRQRLVDFDDLLWQCIRAVESDGEFGAAQRWRFRHFFVDEFQDVNPLQFRLLAAWRDDRPDLCVVGDPNQAIYAWNGAEPAYLVDAPRYLKVDATIALADNYRSTPEIAVIANAVLDAGAVRGVRLRPTRPNGPIPTVTAYASDRHEARAIARAALDRHSPGVPWSHQAVLVRTHAQAVQIAEALSAVQVPVRLRGQAAFLQLPEIRSALAALRKVRGSFAAAVAAVEAELKPIDLRDDTDDAFDLDIDEVDEAGGPDEPAGDAERERRRNVEELVRLAGDYESDEQNPTLEGFEAWLAATIGADEGGATRDAVEIATLHAAKGLEWPIVHIAGLESGLVPISYARTQGAIDEERRLFYVGITRAERELRLSWAQERTFGTKAARRRPSPYLDELEPVFEALAAGTRPVDGRLELPAIRESLQSTVRPRTAGGKRPSDPADNALFDALRTWRATQAKAAKVPAYVVFDDKTLVAIATSKPTTRVQLLDVPGIGPVKAGRFGDDVLTIVREHG